MTHEWRQGFPLLRLLCGSCYTGLLLVAAGCAPLVDMPPPSPDGPRISRIRFSSEEVIAGCQIDLTIHVDSVNGTPTRLQAAWTRTHGRRGSLGEVVMPLEPGTSVGSSSDVTVRFVPQRSGAYRYYVQVEDDQGRRSNVLKGQVSIVPRWREVPCEQTKPSEGSS